MTSSPRWSAYPDDQLGEPALAQRLGDGEADSEESDDEGVDTTGQRRGQPLTATVQPHNAHVNTNTVIYAL